MTQTCGVTMNHSLSHLNASLYHIVNTALISDSISHSTQLSPDSPIGSQAGRNCLNRMFTFYYVIGEHNMDETNENKQTRKSGDAAILYFDDYIEVLRTRGKEKSSPYIVPDNLVMSIRFKPEDKGKPVRVFMERVT